VKIKNVDQTLHSSKQRHKNIVILNRGGSWFILSGWAWSMISAKLRTSKE